ncbi:MAG: hypothetical protein M3459_07185 [Actinomycetota bacterium]|nr:hypothetical protein [Actinomycetota bacterium]
MPTASDTVVSVDQPRAIRRLKVACAAVLAAVMAYWAAAVAGVPNGALSAVFTLGVVVLVGLAWWGARRAPPALRLFAILASLAVTLQVIGTALWYSAFLANDREVPAPPGYWTPFLWIGLLLGVAAAWAAVRRALRLREAVLDYVIVIAAAAAVAAATVSYQLEPGLTGAAVDAAVRPVTGILMVTLVVSAALGRWRALPLPVGLFAVAQVFTALGNVMFGWLTAGAAYTDNRWTGAVWFTGVLVAMLAAAAMILRVDRPIRLAREALPAVSPRALMVAALGAWALVGGVALYGALGGRPAALYAGIAAGVVIGLAVSLRALSALEESRAAYRRLDEAHFSLEQVAAERDETIETLARRNVEHSATQAMLGSLLELADDRSDGQLRARLEETADDLAQWLPQRRK